MFQVISRNRIDQQDDDGCVVNDSQIMGTYIHGIFDNPRITALWLDSIGLQDIRTSELAGIDARDKEYDALSQYFEEHINVGSIVDIINCGKDKY